MTTLTTEELLKRVTPLKDWRFEKCGCGCEGYILLNVPFSNGMFYPEHAELIRRMAASWEAMREACNLFMRYSHETRMKEGETHFEDVKSAILDALALSNGEEPTQ